MKRGGWEAFQNILEVANSIAIKHDVSLANISSRFVFENNAVAALIIGARLGKSQHIQKNKKILNIRLDSDDLCKMQSAILELKPIPGNCGDEYRKPPFLTASGDLSHHLEQMPLPFEVVKVNENKSQLFSGTEWEEYAGYCRAVKHNNTIHVSGSTATHGSRIIGGNDPAAQTHFIIDKIEGAIISFGGSLEHVVRTRIFVNNLEDWEAIARAHGERFKNINPANTLVQARLVGEGYLVEIEAEAEIY